jgi:acyl-CoA thioesterase-1
MRGYGPPPARRARWTAFGEAASWSIIGGVMVRAASHRPALLLAAVALAGACAPPAERTAGGAGPADSPPAAERQTGSAPPTGPESPLVVFLGDSLTAGLGVGEAEAFPEQVRRRLAAEGVALRVVNAGVSGDTTAGGRARLGWVLRQEPSVLVVGLGANDGLRGLALEETEANLRAIVTTARDAGARVLLLGMLLPPNYGPDYTEAFREIFPRLARELEVPLVPFLLTGVASIAELNQADGIHPTAAGHRLIADNLLPQLRALLEADGRPG